MIDCKRRWVALCRMRQSWGFGVHSPFVFALLKDVIREERPYYAYYRLSHLPVDSSRGSLSERVCRLLFRLVNRFQPAHVIEVGTGDGRSMAYLSAARKHIPCVTLDDRPVPDVCRDILREEYPAVDCRTGDVLHELLPKALDEAGMPGLVHIAYTLYYKEAVEQVMACAGAETILIVEDLRHSPEKQAWWRELAADERTGIVIDLYDVGVVFFDKQRVKQLYKMTF